MNSVKKVSFKEFLECIGVDGTTGRRDAGLRKDNKHVKVVEVTEEKNDNNRPQCFITQEEMKKYISFLIYKSLNSSKAIKDLESVKNNFIKVYTSENSFLKLLIEYKFNFEKIINNVDSLYNGNEYDDIKEKSKNILKLLNFMEYTKEEDTVIDGIREVFEILDQNEKKKLYIEKMKEKFSERVEKIRIQLDSISNILESEINLLPKLSLDYLKLDELKYECKLLKPYKDYFYSVNSKISKEDFIKNTKAIFNSELSKIEKVFESLNIIDLHNSIYELNQRIKSNELHQSIQIMENLESVFQFYNSVEGEKLNEYFKSFNVLYEVIKFVNRLIKYTNLDFNDGSYDIEQFRDLTFLNSRIKILGYDYYLEEHILFDLYETLLDSKKIKRYNLTRDKIYDYIKIFLAHSSSFIASNYRGKIIELAIRTDEPRFVEVLKSSLEGINKNSLNVLFENKTIDKMLYPVLECFKDINQKHLYLKIYEGDVEFVEFLYEKNKVEIFKDRYPIEMKLCAKGKNSTKIFEVFLKFLKNNVNDIEYHLIFDSLLRTAIYEFKNGDNTKELVESQIEFIKTLNYVDNLYEHLTTLLNLNRLDIFEKIYNSNKFDKIKLFNTLIKTSSDFIIKPTKESWDKIMYDYFKDIDLSLLEWDIKENFLFSKDNEALLNRLLKESKKYTNAFVIVNEYLKDNPNGKIYCYKGTLEI